MTGFFDEIFFSKKIFNELMENTAGTAQFSLHRHKTTTTGTALIGLILIATKLGSFCLQLACTAQTIGPAEPTAHSDMVLAESPNQRF
jgi:hypothetical protein